jgi:hypothetical protein
LKKRIKKLLSVLSRTQWIKVFCFFFSKKKCLPCLLLLTAANQQDPGRDFPKTLIFDEPGIDDEISLPTLSVLPRNDFPGREIDVAFELDKRLSDWLSLQINTGYTRLPTAAGTASGWQNTSATLKFIVFQDEAFEQLASISLTRVFGGSGAARIGASPTGASTAAFNFGQGFARLTSAAWLKPLAITGSLGALVPDAPRGVGTRAILSASVQYSFNVLGAQQPMRIPAALRPVLPIVECILIPATGSARGTATLAPGLIYAGQGYQLAAEALVPLTRDAGTHVGVIAQLNISLGKFGQGLLF